MDIILLGFGTGFALYAVVSLLGYFIRQGMQLFHMVD